VNRLFFMVVRPSVGASAYENPNPLEWTKIWGERH
jgi:hypothetical protein